MSQSITKSHDDEGHEQQPLLEHSAQEPKTTPLPLTALLILCSVRLAEPISYTQIFPYVNEMMERLKVTDDPAKIGFYSGIVDSMFAVAQLFTIYQWSSLSDRIGRKPVVLIGLSGAALSAMCFGLSFNFTSAVVARALQGLLSGNVAVVNSMVSEITDSTNQGRAFPLLGATWSVGCILGPMIGGTLSYPATRYPTVFGRFQFLHNHPYFLPCAFSSALTLLSIVLCIFFVDETLPRIVKARHQKQKRQAAQSEFSAPSSSLPSGASTPTLYGSTDNTDLAPSTNGPSFHGDDATSPVSSPPVHVPTARELASYPKIRTMLSSGFMLSFVASGWDVVFILLAYEPRRLGGFERSAAQIGYFLSVMGLISTFISIIIFPLLQRRFDDANMYIALFALWPFIYLVMFGMNAFVRTGVIGEGNDAGMWAGIIFILLLVRTAAMNFPLNMILMKKSAPVPEALGATFGLQQTFACLARAIGPALSSSLFAFSVETQALGGYLVWLIMGGVGFVGVWCAAQARKSQKKEEAVSHTDHS